MSLIAYIPLLLFVWLPIATYYWGLYNSLYWKRKKVPSINAKPIVGSIFEMLSFRKSVAQQFYAFYFDKATKDEPFVGFHIFHKPAILIRDPELIKRIVVKDFAAFSNRSGRTDEHRDTIGNTNLFFLKNPAWKDLRSRITPFFTSAKLKSMFHLIKDIGTALNDTITSENINENTKSFTADVKSFFARFATDVIASCAFGLEAKCLKFPNSEFFTYGQKIVEFKWHRALELFSIFFVPEIVSLFRFKVFSKETTNFIRESITYTMIEREKSGNVRQDLIDTLITLKNEDRGKIQNSTSTIVFQDDVLVAQAAVFFAAGFETSSSTMSFALYELCWKPEIQKRLRAEIKDTLIKSKGNISYENIQNMEYLNMVIQESLRMYPSLPFLDRACNEEKGYSLEPFSDFVIPTGTTIIIPVHAIQRDPKNFENPKEFDPERFSAKNKDNIKAYTFIPFGSGPRACIGERLGVMQIKIGLINVLKNHYVEPSDSTPKIMEFEKKSLILQAKGGVILNLIRDPLV